MIIDKFSTKNSYINLEIATVNISWILYIIINRLRLSDLQIDWDDLDLFKLILLIPLSSIFFIFCINIFSILRLKISKKCKVFYKSYISNSKCLLVLLLVIILLVFDLVFNGVPLFLGESPEELNALRLDIRIPFVYSFSIVSLNVLIIFLLFNKYSFYRNILLLTAITFYISHAFLMVARGSVVYLACSISLYYLIYYKTKVRFSKFFTVLAGFIVLLILFDLAGEYREGSDFSIHDYGKFSKDIPASIAWLWGYVIVNLDNLVVILNDEHDFSFKMLQNFSLTIFSLLGNDVTDYQDLPYIGRFNLPTGFGFVAYDFGYFGILAFTTIVFLFLNLVKKMSYGSIGWSVAYIFFIEGILIFPVSNWFISSRGFLFILSIIFLSKLLIAQYPIISSNEKIKC